MPYQNCFEPAWNARNSTVMSWGKDTTGTVSYLFNSQGFRGGEYNYPAEWAFFGCSAVFGVGVPENLTLPSHFESAHNYGLSAGYLNRHSVNNLKEFVKTPQYTEKTRIVFFWIDRPGQEEIPEMVAEVNNCISNVLHISMGQKYDCTINLFPNIDFDASGTHPGPQTLKLWAKTIKLLQERRVY